MNRAAIKHPVHSSLKKQGGVGVGCFFVDENQTAVNDPNGNLTAEYEASLNRGWEYGYSVDGGIRSAKRFYVSNNARQYGTAYTFKTNQAGQVTEMTDGLGAKTVFEYDRAGRPGAVTDANRHSVFIGFNRDGQLGTVRDSGGNEVSLTYQSGLPQAIVRKAGNTTLSTETLGYDKRERLEQTTVQDNISNQSQTRRQHPDALGRILERVDALNRSTRYDYDNLGRVKTLTAADGGVTTLHYDLQDNLTRVEDPAGNVTGYDYNNLGQLVQEYTGSDSAPSRHYRYDNNGNLVQAINALGQCTVYGYSAANEPQSMNVYNNAANSSITDCDNTETNLERTITYHYDDFGRYTGASDGETETQYTYETGTDRIASVSTTFLNMTDTVNDTPNTIDTRRKTVQYHYYPNVQLQSYTTPENRQYDYGYDAAGRLDAVSLGPDGLVDLGDYLWDKPRSIRYGLNTPAASETQTLDGLLRRQQTQYSAAQSGNDFSLTYGYNNENHITGITGNPQGDLAYGYDEADRLTSAARTSQTDNKTEQFSYDNAYNRLAANDSQYSYSTTRNGLLDSIATQNSTTTFTHDANGHRTQKTGTENWTYEYNAQERLTRITKNNIEQATYQYNAQGQRVQKTTNTGTTFYLYNSMGLAAEYDQTGTLQKEYGYLPDQPYMTNPVFLRTSTSFAYYQNDHLGTPQRLIDKQGITVWQASYDAFGKASISINTVENNLRFAGQYYDSESGLHQNYFRDYDPETGRYLQRDPIGLNGGINTYGYANANPVLFTDPTGEIVPALVAGGRLAIQCFTNCMLAAGLGNAVTGFLEDGLLCDDFTSDWMKEAASGCAMHCMNPLNWFGPKGPKMAGRGGNKAKPHPKAEGPHSTWKTDANGNVTGYTTWRPNSKNPSGHDQRTRTDITGGSHYDKSTGQRVPTPHTQKPNGAVRATHPSRVPRGTYPVQ